MIPAMASLAGNRHSAAPGNRGGAFVWAIDRRSKFARTGIAAEMLANLLDADTCGQDGVFLAAAVQEANPRLRVVFVETRSGEARSILVFNQLQPLCRFRWIRSSGLERGRRAAAGAAGAAGAAPILVSLSNNRQSPPND